MRFIRLAAFIILSAGPLWALACGSVRAADLTNDAVYGIKLGMSVSEAESVLTEKTSGLSDASLAPGALRIEHVFYDCSSLKTIFVMRALATTASGYRTHFGPQLSPPPGSCTDIDRVRLADGHVIVTYLPTRRGDASSQVVARVELVEAVLYSHALPIEHIPVHYYEQLAVQRYGQPTYRDSFRPHKTVTARPDISFPDGQALYFSNAPYWIALCNSMKCTEHQGWLAWCPANTSATACSRKSGIPDDYTEGRDAPVHYELPFVPRPIVDLGITRGTTVYNQDVARQQRSNSDEAASLHQGWMVNGYKLYPAANGPERRLFERFIDPADPQNDDPLELTVGPLGQMKEPFVQITLEDLSLFRKSFPTRVTVPTPVVTPSF